MNFFSTLKKVYQKNKKKINKIREYRNQQISTSEEGNDLIKKIICNNEPAAIARIGETELNIINEYIKGGGYSYKTKEFAYRNAGIFPNDINGLNEFSEIFIDSLKNIDTFGVWYNKGEGKIIRSLDIKPNLMELRSLEPYYFDKPWSALLKNKRVLVIHPFEYSIKNQYKRYDKLFKNQDILLEFKLITIKAVQSISGNDTSHKSWSGSLNYMKMKISEIDFDIAIIGAGAYGLPLASYIKDLGKIAIHMGGATQLLFGIKGARWDNHEIISKLYNEYWVRPAEIEMIKDADKVEGATYW